MPISLPIFDPGMDGSPVWWFFLGAFLGWLLFVLIDRFFWRDGFAAAEQEQSTISKLTAELESRRAEDAALRAELEARQQEARRLTELGEELRDRAATSGQQVVNLEAALAAARQSAPPGGAAAAAAATALATGIDPSPAPPPTPPPSGSPAQDLTRAVMPEPHQSALFDPVSTIIRPGTGANREARDVRLDSEPQAGIDGDVEAPVPVEPADYPVLEDSVAIAGVAPRPASPDAPAGGTEPQARAADDPAKVLRAALDDADDALDFEGAMAPDDEDLFGAPTEILTAFHLDDDDDGFDDSDILLDADTDTLSRSGGEQADGTVDEPRSGTDRLDDGAPANSRAGPRDADDDMSLVNRLRGAFGRNKPGSER